MLGGGSLASSAANESSGFIGQPEQPLVGQWSHHHPARSAGYWRQFVPRSDEQVTAGSTLADRDVPDPPGR
jgi:hypothetical protein